MSLGWKAVLVAVLTVLLVGLKIYVRRGRRQRAARLREARDERERLHHEAEHQS